MWWMLALQAAGAANAAVGAFYEAKSAKGGLRSRAGALDLQADLADINARQAEFEAQDILQTGHAEAGRVGMAAKAEQNRSAAELAASGTQPGVGSAAEVQASAELLRQIDMMTIGSNATKAAAASRMQRVGYQNESAMARVSASNLRRSADSISPLSSTVTSLLGSATQVAPQWYYMQGGDGRRSR